MSNYQYVLYRAAQVREMDRYAIEQLGISGTVLMERAGAAAFALLRQHWPVAARLAVVCGTGNNGGDGYVLARLAVEAGLKVTVLQVGDNNHLQGDALAAAQRLFSCDIMPLAFEPAQLAQSDVIIDAILGTGLNGAVSEDFAAAIAAINSAGLPVLALDIPSGLNADNGQVMGCAIHAAVTISFIGLKRGLFTGDGPDCCGQVVFESLSLPTPVYAQQPIEVELSKYECFKGLLIPRQRSTHKGHYGHVLVIGGEAGYTGAARMAGEAAARVGAGLVSIGTRAAHAAQLNASRPELMVHALEDEASFQRLAEKANVIAIGPGLGQSEWARNMLNLALESGHPLIVDADGLNLLSLEPRQRHNWILTPHGGEAARMLGQSTQEIHQDRFAAVHELQAQYGGYVILKGAGSLVAGPDLPMHLCGEGNPGMASGGMGDVLTGILAGLLAQGCELGDAACIGVCLHAAAGDAAAKAAGERGMLATDLMPWVRRLANP